MANREVARISDVNIARTRAVHNHTRGKVKSCGAAGAIGAASAAGQTGKSAYHASGCDFADGAVTSIGHIDVVCTVYRESARETETCGAAGAVGTTIVASQPSKRTHDTGGRDFADGAVVGIGDEDVADVVDGHSDRTIKAGGAAGAIGAASAAGQTGKGSHDTGRRDLADGTVNGVGHIGIVCAIHRHAGGTIKPRGAAGPIRAAGREPRKGGEGVWLISALRLNAERG